MEQLCVEALREYQRVLLAPLAPTRMIFPFPQLLEQPKPQHSYIGLIAMAILSSPEKKMVLSEVYEWIMSHYAYFRSRGSGWRNSIRHNLSLNDCFVKAGRAANGKGHYWAIHPACVRDFERGDFRRRRAQRKVRRHMGLSVPEGDSTDDSTPSSPASFPPLFSLPPVLLPKPKNFTIEYLLSDQKFGGGRRRQVIAEIVDVEATKGRKSTKSKKRSTSASAGSRLIDRTIEPVVQFVPNYNF